MRRINKKVFKQKAAFKPETLSSDKLKFWQKFDRAKVFKLLTGNPNRAPDYHEYLQCYWHQPAPPVVIAPAPAPAPLILPQVQPNMGRAFPPAPARPQPRTSRTKKNYGPPTMVTWSIATAGTSTPTRGRSASPAPCGLPDSKGPLLLDRQ